MVDDLFWNSTVDEIVKGYTYLEKEEKYICLICGKRYDKGVIYKDGEKLLEAEKAVKNHIIHEHNSVFDYLINMDKKYTGLTENQKVLIKYFYAGLSDKEIVEKIGEGSTSTIRTYRFKFREREKEAKIILAMMQLLKLPQKKVESEEKFIPIHRGAKMIDDRFAITEDEREKVVNKYFKNGKLLEFPTKQKRKIIVLTEMWKKFDPTKKYTEKEVNEIIKEIYFDYVTIRRYFIEYGFMERTIDCKEYWVKVN
jgi:hypothetical protein